MILLEREFLTVSDEGDRVWMNLDTSMKAVREVAEKMSEIRPGLVMDGKGWEAFLKYYRLEIGFSGQAEMYIEQKAAK